MQPGSSWSALLTRVDTGSRIQSGGPAGAPSSARAPSPSRAGSSHAEYASGFEDDRHPVVDRPHQVAGRGGDDREAVLLVAAFGARPRPQPGEREQLVRAWVEVERLWRRLPALPPLAGLLAWPAWSAARTHSKKPSVGTRQRLRASASRNTCFAFERFDARVDHSGGRLPGLVRPRTGSGPSASS